jgi:hypothetical protein
MLNLEELREAAITLYVDADELCFDAKWHTSLFPPDELPPIKRRLRERLHELSLRADQLREALDSESRPEGRRSAARPAVPWYRTWFSRRAQQVEPVSRTWLQDLYRRTRILLSTATEFIDPNGMGTRH